MEFCKLAYKADRIETNKAALTRCTRFFRLQYTFRGKCTLVVTIQEGDAVAGADEELEQLRAEKIALLEAVRRKDEELDQSRQANQDLRAGLKQAIMAIESQQERIKTPEGLIAFLQERVKTLEGQQAKDSHNSS